MFSILIFFFTLISSIICNSYYHRNNLTTIIIDPNNFLKSDIILHDFRYQFQSTYPYRCLLQTQSKYFYLNTFCQLLTRTSLKQFCSLNVTLKLEIVLPKNTTLYDVNINSNQTYCNQTYICQFEKNPYRIRLKEHKIYKNFLQIKTLSSCLASNYLLSTTNSKKNFELFSLNSSNGYLSLVNPLDYESMTTWKLVIQADDMYHIPFYTYAIIEVDDINDCPPLISWNFPLQIIEIVNETDPFHIEISIDESKVEQKQVIIANLILSDLDSPPKFDLKLNSSEYLPFNIDGPYGDATYVLVTNSKLDREYQDKYILNLVINDYGTPMMISYYRLTLNILDNNDNSPKFDKDIYYIDVKENNMINSTLIQIFAYDSDIDENGRVTYEINDEYMNYVSIDSQTGIIRANIQFDYEQIKNFSFNVTAMDHPINGQQYRTTAKVYVNIINQNDNSPKFSKTEYEFSIYENNIPHSLIGTVLASDIDNSPLTYTIDKATNEILSLFYVSSTDGKIYAEKSLDREENDQYNFNIIAYDGHYKSSRIKIRINVLDRNDENPRFIFPNDNNDTLIIDRNYWDINDYICQIEIQDNDQIKTYTLLLIYHIDQLKNYDYLNRYRNMFHFDSSNFFLDQQERLFFNSTNRTILNEGVYYLAFKIVDGKTFYEEKLLKLVVVNNYDSVEIVMKKYDYLGLHINNRLNYLKNQHSKLRRISPFDHSNRYFLLILFSILTVILIGITFIFTSLIKRKPLNQKSNSTKTKIQQNKYNLTNKTQTYDYNDSSLLILNKDLIPSSSLIHDKCCLLETKNENDIYDQQKNKIYTSRILSTSNLPESHYSQQNHDSSATFHSFNHFPIPSNELYSSRRHATIQPPAEYSVAIVSAAPTNNALHTPASSDDGFCGSSDISDSILPNRNNQYSTINRQSHMTMKDRITTKNTCTPLTNGTDTTRRVRFNFQSEHELRHYDQIYTSQMNILQKKPINSTVV